MKTEDTFREPREGERVIYHGERQVTEDYTRVAVIVTDPNRHPEQMGTPVVFEDDPTREIHYVSGVNLKPYSTEATDDLMSRLRAAVADWDAAGNQHHQNAGKASTQQKTSYYEGKGDGYHSCATALDRILKEFDK